tara:strand:+ start:1600 stop:1737 length:138 start_codon:yes stop_codon:yes gene_type:complete
MELLSSLKVGFHVYSAESRNYSTLVDVFGNMSWYAEANSLMEDML